MFCYEGAEFSRIYMNRKSKRVAWEAYMRNNAWVYDFYDLKCAYKMLFSNWDDQRYWTEEEAYLDDHF